jgi:RND superfamily putative drug exporter
VSGRYRATIVAVARLASRHARLVVAAWVVVVGILAFVGRNAEHELGTHALFIKGSPVQRAHEIAVRQFGTYYGVVVLLQGPPEEVERQGRTLAARLGTMPHSLVMSPWVSGSAQIEGLSPRPGVGALLVRLLGSSGDQLSGLLPPVQSRIDATVRSPVRVSLAGQPVLVDSIQNAAAKTSAIGDLIGIPVLLFILLFVFRSVIAALVPLVAGGCVVGATRGIVILLDGTVHFDFLVVGLIGMMGLALGVDYSLLVVSRFREERDRGGEPGAVVEATVLAAARSIVPAAGAMLLAMVLALIVLSTVLVQAVAVALIVATTLSMISAVCVVPALLKLLGPNLERWSFPSRSPAGGARLRWSRRISRRPGAVGAIVVGLLLFATLAFNLESSVGSIAMLPKDDPGRQQQEDLEHALGPGWAAPTEVVINGRGSPITSSSRLNAIAAFERQVEDDPGVVSLNGLSRVARMSRKVSHIEGQLAAQEKGLSRLQSGLARAGDGSAKTVNGLQRAAAASGELGSGIAATNSGAGGLAGGLSRASAGSSRLARGLGRASEGSGEVARKTGAASDGLGRISDALGRAQEETGELRGSARLIKNAMRSGEARLEELHEPLSHAEEQLAAALSALRRMSAGRSDPEYAAALDAVEEAGAQLAGGNGSSGSGVSDGIEGAVSEFGVGLYLAGRLDRNGEKASQGLGKLARSSRRLDRGMRRLSEASGQVSDGVAALSRSGQQLSPAMRQLAQGAQRLSGGLDLLESGAGQLSSGLSENASRSSQLPRALKRMERGLRREAGESPLKQVQRSSPGVFHSAYFILANLDGTPSGQRAQLGSLIDIDRGGGHARLLVIPRDQPNTTAARKTVERIEGDAAHLARGTGMEVVVGGAAPADVEINRELRDDVPLIRIVLSLISLIVLVPLLRSLTIPILAAIINLITVSASFGVLSVLVDHSVIGGPGYVEATILPAIIIVMFGLAIDYEVFIFARIREEYLRTGSTREAVTRGLDRTGPVVTGAAIIMIAVFLAFSVVDVITVRDFAVAQAIAIFIDAFIVRLIVVPAVMIWLGERCWWCPRWLDRILPGGSSAEGGADALAHGGG